MGRLDKERQLRLEPLRMRSAIKAIEFLGYDVVKVSETEISFVTDVITQNKVTYFPYSGWATGKDIKNGRGLRGLLIQIKKT